MPGKVVQNEGPDVDPKEQILSKKCPDDSMCLREIAHQYHFCHLIPTRSQRRDVDDPDQTNQTDLLPLVPLYRAGLNAEVSFSVQWM